MNVNLKAALIGALCTVVLTVPLGVAAVSNATHTVGERAGFTQVIPNSVQAWLGVGDSQQIPPQSVPDEPDYRWVNTHAQASETSQPDSGQSSQLLAANGDIAVLSKSRAGLIKNLSLSAHLPQQLQVSDHMIRWEVTPLNRPGQTRHISGHWQSLRLPQGNYAVRLNIGEYQRTRHVNVTRQETRRLPFYVNIGRLQLRANEQVNWRVYLPNGKVLNIPRTASAEPIMETGVYRVEASINDSHYHEMVRVDQGETVTARMSIPVGRVNLIAVRNNAPLFQPMHWRIYRLDSDGKREVASYHRHARGIVMPAGRYEAVATFKHTTRSREFWVQKDTNNEVVLTMD